MGTHFNGFWSIKEAKLINLGIFKSKTGKSYDCHFIPDEKMAQAVGPLPERVGSRGVVFKTRAESEQEARQKISAAIESGTLK
jgi:hypothetical protein